MILKLLIFIGILGNTNVVLSKVGKVICLDKTSTNLEGLVVQGQYCTYTIKNLASVSELSRKVEQALFNGDPLIQPSGILQSFGNNNQTLIFSHSDQEVLNQMKAIIPLMDAKESFSPNDVIRINADVYEVTESGLSNLGMAITNLSIGTGLNSGLDDHREVNVSSEGLTLGLRAGSYQIAGLLEAQRNSGNLNKITKIVSDSYNLNKYEYSDITNVYQAPGAGTTIKQEEEGIKISAKLSINDRQEDTVVLKDFNLYYGVSNGDGSVNQLNIPMQRLVLKEGIMFPIVSSKIIGKTSSRSSGILNFNRSSNTQNKKLLVYLSVDIMKWDEYLAKMAPAKFKKTKNKFTQKEIKELPSECPTNQELISGIRTIALRGQDGVPVLSFYLDKSLACKKNIKKWLNINTNGGGIENTKNKHIVRVQELMHKPIRIVGVQDKYYSSFDHIKFWVNISLRKKRNVFMTHVLEFMNSENQDISDRFENMSIDE